MKKILFIVNPLSSKKLLIPFEKHAKKVLAGISDIEYSFRYSEYPGNAYEVAWEALNDFDIFVAVGGDGTVNHVSKALIHTNKLLGIIPIGSGNGLGRHLKIPLQINKAIHLVATSEKSIQIDTCLMNEHHFVNLAGIGIDSFIANMFASSKRRGFYSYLRSTLHSVFQYKADNYCVTIDGKTINKKALLVSFANSDQFGNNAYICPKAMINDGYIDICIVPETPIYKLIPLAIRMFAKTIDKSEKVEIYRCKNVVINTNKPIIAHTDGEPLLIDKEIEINILHNSINVIVQ